MRSLRFLILGSNGNLSLEFQRQIAAGNSMSFQTVSSTQLNELRKVRNGFKRLLDKSIDVSNEFQFWIINTCGDTNPKSSVENLHDLNVDINLEIAEAINGTEVGLITLGTVMERFPLLCKTNPYLYSKLECFDELKKYELRKHLHVRLHTLYGGRKLHNHMFLAQLFHSINSNDDFIMTKGNQVREYHHVEDDVSIILRMMFAGVTGIHDVSSGKSTTLIALAREIYSRLLPERRVLPIMESSFEDVYNTQFDPLPNFDGKVITFRDSIEGIVSYFQLYR
jgi:nucleoside-diphosphate-sugar epimerase